MLEQRRRRLAPKPEPLDCAPQPVEHLHRLLALAGRVGELLLGSSTLGQHRLEPLLGGSPRQRRCRLALVRLGKPFVERGQVELGDARTQLRDLAAQLLGALGCRRLQRERPQTLAHFFLEISGALDLRCDARELQLGAMAAGLEAAQPGGLLDERAPLLGLRREDRLDFALADDRVHPLAEAEIGEQLDEIDPPYGSLVHKVLALAAAMEPARDRELGELDRPRAVVVVEQKLDLAEVGRAPVRCAGEEHVVGLLGPQLVRTERAGGPADGVGDVRLAGAVRPDDHADARLEAHLDEIREGLEATQFDGAQMHRSQAIESDGCRYSASSRLIGASSSRSKISRIPGCSSRRDSSSSSLIRRCSELDGRLSAMLKDALAHPDLSVGPWTGADSRQGLARSLLLRGLLRAPLADPELLAVDDRGAREVALVRGPLGREHHVGDLLAAPRERLVFTTACSIAANPCSRKSAPSTASSKAASTLRFFASRSISSAWRSAMPNLPRRRPRSSSRATTAQLARDTTCERIFARRPSENSG